MKSESIGESAQSPEELNHTIEQMLLSCERAGEGGKAVVLKLSVDDVSPELLPALDALKIDSSEGDQAIKLFKLYLPEKGAWEYKMQQQAYDAVQNLPEEDRANFALVPALSSQHEVFLTDEVKYELGKRFGASIIGNETQLIAMEYVDGEDLATVFYKWILEREHLFSAEETDAMNFARLYEEVAGCLGFEAMPDEPIHDQRALGLAERKISGENTTKLYNYLHKHSFPLPVAAVTQIENTIKLLHQVHITHGDAFEKNIMITGGMKALRSTNNLDGQRPYVIDFGEAKDHFVEGVDEFAVVRRLKGLTQSDAEKSSIAQNARFKELDSKMAAWQNRDRKWNDAFSKAEELSHTNKEQALTFAWSRTAAIDRAWTDRFFAIAKSGIEKGFFSYEDVLSFTKEKISQGSPYEKRSMQELLQWLS